MAAERTSAASGASNSPTRPDPAQRNDSFTGFMLFAVHGLEASGVMSVPGGPGAALAARCDDAAREGAECKWALSNLRSPVSPLSCSRPFCATWVSCLSLRANPRVAHAYLAGVRDWLSLSDEARAEFARRAAALADVGALEAQRAQLVRRIALVQAGVGSMSGNAHTFKRAVRLVPTLHPSAATAAGVGVGAPASGAEPVQCGKAATPAARGRTLDSAWDNDGLG
jgi:hypothetical protein